MDKVGIYTIILLLIISIGNLASKEHSFKRNIVILGLTLAIWSPIFGRIFGWW